MPHPLDLSFLNAEQRQAVTSKSQRLLILAGAGTGKTKVLTSRIAYLLSQGVRAEQIVGLTFTNKAAQEMRHRLSLLVDQKSAQALSLSTFHSFCMKILRQEIHHLGFTSHFSLYDQQDMNRLMRIIARDALKFEGLELPSFEKAAQAIQHAIHRGISPANIQGTGSEWHDQFSQNLLEQLQISLRAHNALDFDHLLTFTVQLLEGHPEVRQKYQQIYRYLLIDEYQDTNPVQYQLTQLLLDKNSSLTVVGDDDQSIYAFRGADVTLIQKAQAEVIKLQQNYRSTNSILQAANAVIKNNTQRHEKQLWSNLGQGEPLSVFVAPSDLLEAEAIAHHVATLKRQKGLNWRDIAILYRSNSLSAPIELALMKYRWLENERYHQGIPYRVFGGQEFYEKKEVKDILAYLRLILNRQDTEALLRVINYPRRGMGATSLDQLTKVSRQSKKPLWHVLQEASDLSTSAKKGMTSFTSLIEELSASCPFLPLSQTVKKLLENINYKRAIHEEVKSDKMRDLKWDNIQQLVSSLESFEEKHFNKKDKENPASSRMHLLRDFISSLTLQEDKSFAGEKNTIENAVSLMTFHSAKGLEFPACFLVALEDHLMPHERSTSKEAIEEERRLMYVALTRAQKYLTLSMAKQRKRMGKEMPSRPSRFLFEIPKELIRPIKWDTP